MTKIILKGCMGNLGTAIYKLAENDRDYEIVSGIDVAGSGNGLSFPMYSDISLCDRDADVVVDCSTVESVPELLEFGVKKHIPLVICTTGLPKELQAEVVKASEKVAILQSANMSIGINLLMIMVQRAAKLLEGFDIEIIEKHHNKKVDAPSGTAIVLADAINKALDDEMEYIYDRSKERKRRSKNEIGMHALRGGTIVGEHSVVFAGVDEVIEFKHQILSREVFAVGALRAARFMKGRPPGFYTMQDLMEAFL